MYCIYLRKSRADIELEAKGELETLARHRKTLLEHAQRYGLAIGAVYEEIVSGETIQDRPVVQRLLDEIEQGAWDGVLVMEVERLARGDTIDQGIVARAFRISKAKIVTPLKTYDPSNEYDEEYFEFGLFMSRREYKAINRRIQRGRVASAKEGKFLGSAPPYGYDKVRIPGSKGFMLSPNPKEAENVRYIFNRYVSGAGAMVIAAELDAMGAKPTNAEVWPASTIHAILKNPVYIGKLRWSYTNEQKYMKDGKLTTRSVINDNPIYVDGLHEAIISEDMFNQAAAIRASNTKNTTKRGYELKNSLSGILYCKKCGTRMTRSAPTNHTTYDYIKCPNRYCDNVSAPLYLVEEHIIKAISEWLEDIPLKLSVNDDADESIKETLRRTILSTRAEIDKLKSQLARTYDLLEQGTYSVEVFTARNNELSDKIAAAEKQLTDMEIKLQGKNSNEDLRERLPEMISALRAYSDARTGEEKNRLLRQLLSRVEYLKTQQNRTGGRDNANFEIDIYPKYMP